MSYLDIVYPEDQNNSYSERLCDHLIERFCSFKKCDRVLDIGCGKGEHLKYFCKKLNADGFGVDEDPIEISGMEIKKNDFETQKLQFSDSFFDVIFCKSVCEHVVNIENFFSEIYRVLKPGGVFICMTPDWISQMKNFYDDFTHVRPFTIKSIMNCLKVHRFKVERIELFYQIPTVWKYPLLKMFLPIVALLPDSMKWKTSDMSNTLDRKIIRFSKEKMILAVCTK